VSGGAHTIEPPGWLLPCFVLVRDMAMHDEGLAAAVAARHERVRAARPAQIRRPVDPRGRSVRAQCCIIAPLFLRPPPFLTVKVWPSASRRGFSYVVMLRHFLAQLPFSLCSSLLP
jgi:hypothetical protein